MDNDVKSDRAQGSSSQQISGARQATVPAPLRRKVFYGLSAIVLLALGLRIWGINFGLPHDFTPDEVHEIIRALKLGTGDYTWKSGKGGLYFILFIEYGFLFVFWWLTDVVQGPTDFAIKYLQDPTAFYLMGRVTVAVMGAATCVVIYSVGRRIYGWRAGLWAALIGATAYYHAMWSHHINVDTGMVLAAWASVWAYLLYEERHQLRWLVLAGALVGISVAFKIPGGIFLLALLLAIATSSQAHLQGTKKLKAAVIVTVVMGATVAIVSPENIALIGRLPSYFSRLFVSEASAAVAGEYDVGDIYELTILGGGSYVAILLANHNITLTFAALVGVAIGLWRRERWSLIFLAVVVAYIGTVALADRLAWERYLMPVIPAFWLLGARSVEFVSRGRAPVAMLVMAVIIAPPFLKTVEQNHTWTRPDTRVLAKAWIEEHLPGNSTILMDGMQYRFIMSPPLLPNTETVERRVNAVSMVGGRVSRGVSDRMLDLYAQAMEGMSGPRYDLYSTVWGLAVRELDYYVESCFDYIITSSEIQRRFERPENVERYPDSAQFYDGIEVDPRFKLIYAVEPVQLSIQGPTIKVYRINHACGLGVDGR